MADILKFIVDEELIDTDPHGYLLKLEDWSEDVAQKIADDEEIALSDDHWEIVHFLRNYYSQFGIAPNVRTLRKALKSEYGEDKSSKKYLYDLFPKGPSRQGCRIAGLPLPNDCVDWHG